MPAPYNHRDYANLTSDHPAYIRMRAEDKAYYDEINRKHRNRARYVNRVLELLESARSINRSKLAHMSDAQIIRLGHALRKVDDQLKEMGF